MDCVEDEPQWVEGNEVPVDSSGPNPNKMEFDNLYLVRLQLLANCSCCSEPLLRGALVN